MKLTVNKKDFVDCIVAPASKLSDNLLLTVKDGKLKTLTSSSDNSVILQASTPYKGELLTNLIIPEIKTFLRLFSNIEDIDLTLTLNDNQIIYEGKNFSFKYHLLDENYFTNKKSLNEEKLNKLAYDITFKIERHKLSEILKYNSIIPDAEKLYFYFDENKVIGKVGDEQKPNINEITTILSEKYTGETFIESLPINIQNVLLLSFPDTDFVEISINKELKVFKFESSTVRYIVSGLVK
jgi:hypothetical protein